MTRRSEPRNEESAKLAHDRSCHYRNAIYQRRRKLQLQENPLCERCLNDGLVTPATVTDHVIPHRGDVNIFLMGPLQSLCYVCHNSLKKREEFRGYQTDIGPDGYPQDSRHPVYQGRSYPVRRDKHGRSLTLIVEGFGDNGTCK